MRITLDVFRTPDGWLAESTVLGTVPQRTAAKIHPIGGIMM